VGWDLHIRKVARTMGISSSHTVLPTVTRSACDGFRDNPCWRGSRPSIQEVSSVTQRIPPKAVRPPHSDLHSPIFPTQINAALFSVRQPVVYQNVILARFFPCAPLPRQTFEGVRT